MLLPFVLLWEKDEILGFDALFEMQFLVLLLTSSVIAFALSLFVLLLLRLLLPLLSSLSFDLILIFFLDSKLARFYVSQTLPSSLRSSTRRR